MKRLFAALILSSLPLARAGAPAATVESAQPLPVGAAAPAATVRAPDGAEVDLGALVCAQPPILSFYRGGWCPYCNRHLEELQGIEADLLKLGYQIIALSPDRPEALAATTEKNHLAYRLFSDRAMHAADAWGTAFVMPDDIVAKYGKWNIDLAPLPGDDAKRWLPVPAVFVVTDGTVRFVHSEPDYKVRLAADAVLAAAQAVLTTAK
ncbi:MAG: peroxiredoxin-like family protein [Cephaloticoccus sp.]